MTEEDKPGIKDYIQATINLYEVPIASMSFVCFVASVIGGIAVFSQHEIMPTWMLATYAMIVLLGLPIVAFLLKFAIETIQDIFHDATSLIRLEAKHIVKERGKADDSRPEE